MLVAGVILPWLVSAALAQSAPDVTAANPARVRPARNDAALVIGNHAYASLPSVPDADTDAAGFQGYLTGFAGVRSDRIVTLQDAGAQAMADGLTRAAGLVRKKGTLWVYYAGHGAAGERGQRLLLGTDASGNIAELAGVSVDWLTSAAAASSAAHVVLVLDAGFGGVGRDGRELYAGQRFTVGAAGPLDPRVTVWTATTGAEPAALLTGGEHGLFTWCVLGALRGWADGHGSTPADDIVQLAEAQSYVARLARSLGGTAQRPSRDARAELAEWPLARAVEPAPPAATLDALAEAARAERIRAAQVRLYARATADWNAVASGIGTTVPAVGSPKEAELRGYLARYDSVTVQVDGQDYVVVVPEVTQARAALDAIARAAPVKKQPRKRGSAKKPPPVAAAPVAPALACADLVALEPLASAGKLPGDMVTCLESWIDGEPVQTTRDKVSRVLLVNAAARGDDLDWARLAIRHLETIDRSDPDMALKYALILSRGDIADAEDVIYWSEVALENKARWEGATFSARVYALYRLRAEAAWRLWVDAEQALLQDPAAWTSEALGALRGRAKDDAREWVDYARKTRQPAERAQLICESAAGTVSFCAP